MGTRGRMVLLVVGGLLIVFAVAYAMTHPVLLSVGEGPLPGDRRLVMLRPFRDREPETVAAEFLA